MVGWWPTTVAVPTPTRAPQIFGHLWDFDPPDCRLNVAVTVVSVLTVRVQDPVPAQAPFQPKKEEPLAGSAVRVNTVPDVTDCEQTAAPQLMSAGVPVTVLPVTVPEPGPDLVTESVTGV